MMFVTVRQRFFASQRWRALFVTKSANSNSPQTMLTLRWKSSNAVINRCPHQTNREEGSADDEVVELVNVPKLPFIGSLISQHSGMEKNDLRDNYNVWHKNQQKFGHFYSIGLPSFGKGILKEVFIITDPNEFMKVLRKEGPLPFGPLALWWPFTNYYKNANESGSRGASGGAGFLSVGPQWQKFRRFIQSDLLHPSAAKGYVSGVIKASQKASKGAPLHSKNVADYMALCSFDMFSSVAFGEFPGLASGKSNLENEENEKFCASALTAFGEIFPMVTSPLEIVKKSIGIKSELYSKFEENFTAAREIAHAKVKRFRTRKANGELQNDFQEQSYANLSIDRHFASVGQADALTEDEAAEMIVMGLIAALDTTSSVLNWTVTHLALNPDVQEELHREVVENVANLGGGVLTDACFTKSNNLYLDAVLRENHRMTPPVIFNLTKENVMADVEIHGRTIPRGNMFMLDTRSMGMNPTLIKDPDVFDPTRWSKKEVQDRRGTPAEVLDHPLYKEPFSAGARKCPGSRVASYEAKILLSQLVLDWKITIADDDNSSEGSIPKSWRDIKYQQGLTIQPKIPELTFERRQ